MIGSSARKKFRSDVAPSDRQLWAIGMVVVRWTLIEQYVTAFVHSFTDADVIDPVRSRFDSTRSMQSRLDQWEELSRSRLEPKWVEPMLALINEVRQVLDMRDKIVHGAWADKENANIVSPEAFGPFSWGNPGHRFTWRLNYQGILNVALRIDRLQGALFDFAFNARETAGAADAFTISSALKRIQKGIATGHRNPGHQ